MRHTDNAFFINHTHFFFLTAAGGIGVTRPHTPDRHTNSRYRFPIFAREFTDRWSLAGWAHHCTTGVGHIADGLDKLGCLLGTKDNAGKTVFDYAKTNEQDGGLSAASGSITVNGGTIGKEGTDDQGWITVWS